ncbi:hypothetical protein HanIR_Chr10g0470831 [Helianthus annuus]|nr:hypothetical protein HanIR_Chr10g0470831 [Helianthus annuus]
MSKKLDFLKPELTLRKFGIELFLMKQLQNTSKMLLMVSLVLRIDENVVDEDDDKFIQIRLAEAIHEIHECGRCVSEPKRHH